METLMKNDLYFEHPQHNTYLEGCSSCWAERMVMKARTNQLRKELGKTRYQQLHEGDDPYFTSNPLE